MKKLFLTVLAACILVPFISADAQVSVRGYYRKDGTYVRPHMRSSPNSTTLDNYSTRGNINPYTGQPGTRSPGYSMGRSSNSLLGGSRRQPLGLSGPRYRRR